MVNDVAELARLRAEWDGARRMMERMQQICAFSFASGAIPGPIASVVYNLPLLLAFDVLSQTLAQLATEKQFECKRMHLGLLVEAAKTDLPWLDWHGIRDGVQRRNEVAHKGALFEADVCVADIARIESQLAAWNVIDAPIVA